MNTFASLADDYFVNLNLNTEMQLPASRETVLEFFGRVQKSYPRMRNFYTRESGETQATNDLARNESIKSQVLASMNLLGKTAPYFSTGSTWSQSGNTYTNGDLVITYVLPTGVTNSETRTGQEITVRATYHQDLIVPIIPLFLPKDSNGRMTLTGEVTMVVN